MLHKCLGVSILFLAVACHPAAKPSLQSDRPSLRVLAAESFLADIAQHVAGERLTISILMPNGADPHTFEPTPRDVGKVAECDVLIINGAGFEAFLEAMLQNAGGQRQIIEASAGLTNRITQETGTQQTHSELDPHFWLNPNHVVHYVENIRDGLSQTDPAGAATYAQNAADYIAQLQGLDAWIVGQVQQIPVERRLLVTNHESLGYFADRYGFTVVGAVIPNISDNAAPSAQQLAALVDQIRLTGAPAIFLETGTNPRLAEQVARETGIRVITDLYTHSLSKPDGPAPSYIEMMQYDTRTIVDALK
jgi:ABC-type Zn uptake system ZnuABC Zn-binding protein ZnuA